MNRLSQTASIYGYQLASYSDEDAHEIVAKDFQRRANSFLQEFNGQYAQKYRGPIHSYVHFVTPLPSHETKGFDTFVAPLLFRKGHEFGVFISMKILRGIQPIFTYLELGPEKTMKGLLEADFSHNFEKVYHFTFASLVYILMHELSHVLRIHIPYLHPQTYQKANAKLALAMHEGENLSASSTPDKIRLHRSMEIEADLVGIGLIVELLSNDEMERAFLWANDEFDDPAIFGQAIFLLMSLLELWRQTVSKEPYQAQTNGHPHPEIRQLFIDSWIRTRKKEERGEKFFQVVEGLKKGMDEIREKIDAFGPKFLPGLQYIMNQGHDKTLQEYEVIQRDLYHHLKPSLANFTL